MWVIDLENSPDRLRGSLARWAVEVRAGLYVGSSGPKARDAIWALVAQLAREDTSAVLIFDTRGPQGFGVRTLGHAS
jgi:CRISPR-associated protein Cas2